MQLLNWFYTYYVIYSVCVKIYIFLSFLMDPTKGWYYFPSLGANKSSMLCEIVFSRFAPVSSNFNKFDRTPRFSSDHLRWGVWKLMGLEIGIGEWSLTWLLEQNLFWWWYTLDSCFLPLYSLSFFLHFLFLVLVLWNRVSDLSRRVLYVLIIN